MPADDDDLGQVNAVGADGIEDVLELIDHGDELLHLSVTGRGEARLRVGRKTRRRVFLVQRRTERSSHSSLPSIGPQIKVKYDLVQKNFFL